MESGQIHNLFTNIDHFSLEMDIEEYLFGAGSLGRGGCYSNVKICWSFVDHCMNETVLGEVQIISQIWEP